MYSPKNQSIFLIEFLHQAENRLHILIALSKRQWEPYRLNWVEGLLNSTIIKIEKDIKYNKIPFESLKFANSVLEDYQSALQEFINNKSIEIQKSDRD